MAKKKKAETLKKLHKDHNALLLPAGIFLGLGVGIFIGNAGAGLLTGMGAGFLGMALHTK